MAYVGKIFPTLTHFEIDEEGHIWQTINNIGDTIIEELDAASKGQVTVEIQLSFSDYEDDPLDQLWESRR